MAVSSMKNVRIVSASGDTISGRLSIGSVKVVAGSAAASAQLSVGGVVVYDSGSVSTGAASIADEACIQVQDGDTLTVTLSGAGAKVYLYLK